MTASALTPVSRCIDREAIRLYAEISGDTNPIHLDPDFAATTPMKGIIAHGMLSLNLVWQMLRLSFGSAGAEATLDVRFVRPVREDDIVTANGRDAPGGGYEVWAENQDGEVVISGTAHLRRAAPPP